MLRGKQDSTSCIGKHLTVLILWLQQHLNMDTLPLIHAKT